jgi:Zn-dependent protease
VGWQDRRYEGGAGGGGAWRAVWRRVLGEGDDILRLGFRLYTFRGIAVHIHLLFVLFVIFRMIASLGHGTIGPGYQATGLAILFGLVLLHEYGHCFACRAVGGNADRILLWPLGGLAFVQPPHDWRPSLVTTLGGPAVNVVLWPLFAGGLWIATQSLESAIFNPFAAGAALSALELIDGSRPFWLIALWWAHLMNQALLLFNVLLPMYPMDGGRILQALLWSRLGYERATITAARVGMVLAAAVAVAAITFNLSLLLAIAFLCALECWNEKRRVEFASAGGLDWLRAARGGEKGADRDDARARAKSAKREIADQAELDRLLAKIAREGMASLSGREKRWLDRAARRRRTG